MSLPTTKDSIFETVYYDLGGFGSAAQPLKDAQEKDISITMDEIKAWRKTNVPEKKQLKGYNSFVAEKPRQEYQMDLAFFDMEKDAKYAGALFVIDIVTKYAAGVPFKTKPDEILECIKQGINQMGGNPGTFYTDKEGAFNSTMIQEYSKKKDTNN